MNKLSRLYMTGLIRMYLIYMFAFIVAITTATLFIKEAFVVDMDSFTALNAYGSHDGDYSRHCSLIWFC